MSAPILLQSLSVLAWMAAPVFGGYLFWRAFLARLPESERRSAALARVLGRVAIIGSATPLMVLVFWAAPLPSGRSLALPLIGLSVHASGAVAAWAAARALRMRADWQGAFFLGGGSSNVLTFGGITVVLLLRSASDPHAERALGEMALYRIFEAPFYFLIAWPLAGAIAGGRVGRRFRWSDVARRALRSVTLAPLLGIALGWTLNVAGLRRPPPFDGAAEALVKANVVLLGATVGLGLRRAAPVRHLKPCVAISSVKFALMPALAVGLVWALGFPGTTLQVVAICASMPVAFMAVVGATLYRVADDLVGSFWLFTTAAMAVVVPVLAWVVPRLGG